MSQKFNDFWNGYAEADNGIETMEKRIAHDSWNAAKKEIIALIEKNDANNCENGIICFDGFIWEKIKKL